MSANTFDFAEYSVFIISLGISTLIGIYFGCIKGGQDTVSGYLFGGKQMNVFPVGMSLVSTFVSGITLLGVPTEVYTYGTQYLVSASGHIVVTLFILYFILPVFYDLQLISLYEYMELRFSPVVRKITSFLFILQLLPYIPIVIYGPALALNQVLGMDVHIVTPIICVVCIFYTALGGLKAVVWSDTLQGTVMIGAVLAVLYLGLKDVGGVSEVIHLSEQGDRIEFFNMNTDPTVRLSFWSSTVGLIFYWLAHFAYSPSAVQRFISLPTFNQAKIAVVFLCFGVITFTLLSGFLGLIIYAKYKDCDPLTSMAIGRPDQIVPLFVSEVGGHLKGLNGLFMAGVVCAALSSMSTGLNTVAGTIYQDFLEPLFASKPSDKRASRIIKFLVVLFGTVCALLVFVMEKLGKLVELTTGLVGTSAGSILGIFLLGMFIPCSNTKGAIIGGSISIVSVVCMMLGNAINTAKGLISHPIKPISTQLCSNITTILPTASVQTPLAGDVFLLFRISIFYYSSIGCLIVLLVGLPVSLLTRNKKQRPVDLKLLSPLVRYFYKTDRNYKFNSISLKNNNAH